MDAERPATEPFSSPRSRLAVRVALAALAVFAAFELFSLNPSSNAIDFYLYWAVPRARALSSHKLGDPYTERAAYAAVLRDHAAGKELAGFVAHRWSMRYWDPTGTPLFYASFSPLPAEYLTAARLYRALEVLALGLGLVALGILNRLRPPAAALLACVTVVAFTPVRIDLDLGNFNAIQLGSIGAALWLAARVLPESRGRLRPFVLALLVTGLGWMVLMKPNLAWVALALGGHLGLRHGGKALGAAVLMALPPLGLLAVLSALFFGSGGVWWSWAHYLLVANPEKLAAYAPRLGNVSLPRFLAEALGLSVGAATLLGLLAFALGFAVVAARRGMGAPELIRRSLSDPGCAASLGVLLGLLLAPLAWWHYYVLLLVPAWWTAGDPRGAPTAAVLTGAALLLDLKLPLARDSVLASAGLGVEPRVALYVLSFVLLLAAFFARLAAPAHDRAGCAPRG